VAFSDKAQGSGRKARQRCIARVLADVPEAETGRARIRAVYAQATELEHHDGARWYPTAGRIALQVADAAGHRGNLRLGAGIIAALSPQCSWDVNITRAFSAAEDGADGPWTEDGARKVALILAGADPADVLGGRKVRSFFANIIGQTAPVTIDRHAVAIVYGRALSDREIKVLERTGAYLYLAGLYRSVARELDIEPSTLQAVTWLAWRRTKNVRDVQPGEVF